MSEVVLEYVYWKKENAENLLAGKERRKEFLNHKIAQFKAMAMKREALNKQLPVLTGMFQENITDDWALAIFMDGIANAWNQIVDTKSYEGNSLFKQMTELMSHKFDILRTLVPPLYGKGSSIGIKKIDEAFQALLNIYQTIHGVEPAALVYFMQQKIKSGEISGKTQLGMYLSALAKQMEGKEVEITNPEALEKLANVFAQAQYWGKEFAKGFGSKAVREMNGRLSNIFNKDIGEEVVARIILSMFDDVDQKITSKFLQGATAHTTIAKDASGNPVAMHTGATRSNDGSQATRADNIVQMGLDINGYTVNGYIGFSDKWVTAKTYDNPNSKLFGKSAPKSSVTVLDKAPVMQFIDELVAEQGNRNRLVYTNAYPHEITDFTNIIEYDALLAGLMGTGKQITGQTGLFDTTSFLVVNGHFFSTLKLFTDILDIVSDGKHKGPISFSYKDKVKDPGKWEGNEPDLLQAKIRSAKVVDRLKNMKITVKVAPRMLAY